MLSDKVAALKLLIEWRQSGYLRTDSAENVDKLIIDLGTEIKSAVEPSPAEKGREE